MKNLGLVFTLFMSLSAISAELDCINNNGGFSVRNKTTNRIIGSQNSRYNTVETCIKAIRTKVESANGYGIVCASSGEGSGLFTLAGNQVGKEGGFYYEVALCKQAIENMSDWVVCTPGESKSTLIDLRKGAEIPEGGYYNSIQFCVWASKSASSQDKYVCAPTNGGSRIHDRTTGVAVGTYNYDRAEDCYNALRKQ